MCRTRKKKEGSSTKIIGRKRKDEYMWRDIRKKERKKPKRDRNEKEEGIRGELEGKRPKGTVMKRKKEYVG